MRLLSQILFLTLLPLLIILSYNYYQNLKLEKILHERLHNRVDTVSHNIQAELEKKKAVSEKIAQLLATSQLVINGIEMRDVDFLYNRAKKFSQTQIITEVIFTDTKGVILTRASDEFHFNDSIKDTNLDFILEETNFQQNPYTVYFDKKYQLMTIKPIYKYDVTLIGYVITSHIIDKNFLNSLSIDHLYMEFQKNGSFINNFDENFESYFTKININKNLSYYVNLQFKQEEILKQKTKQNYIIIFLLILSGGFIYYFIGKILKPFNNLNKLLLEFSSQNIELKELINQVKGNKNRFNELGEIQNSIILTLEKLNTTQEELLESNNQTLLANRLKDKFLSNMSHKIRTPMNELISFLQLLEKTDLSSKQKKYLIKSFHSIESLSDVINNVLDIAKIESGELELNEHFTDLSKILKTYNKKYKALSSNKNIDFIMKIDDDFSKFQLYIDQIRFNQAVENIIDNAIKFTHSGYVRVEINTANKNKNSLDLIIAIYDTGIGIASSDLPIIFNNFTMCNNNKSEGSSLGAGLGLSISKQIITMMKGTIEVSSKLNSGSAFTILLPNIKYK